MGKLRNSITSPKAGWGNVRAYAARSPRHARYVKSMALVVALGVGGIGALILAASHASGTRTLGKLSPASGAYWGMYTNYSGGISGRESQLGRKLNLDQNYYSWTDSFPTSTSSSDISNGRIPFITWEPWNTNLADIANGVYDSNIISHAQAVKNFGHPIFLRFMHEMNGNWYPWDGSHNGSSSTATSNYIRAWRHVHDLFVQYGATNAVWVWCPNVSDVPSQSWNHWTNYYPGDSYVDWVGIDGYNWGNTNGGWKSFASVFGNGTSGIYADYASHKPIVIAETSSVETSSGAPSGSTKGTWIDGMVSSLPNTFPDIQAVLWFDKVGSSYNWAIDSSSDSMTHYKAGGLQSYVSPAVNWSLSTSSDTTAPTTSVTSPTAGSTVQGTVSVNASASDNVGVTKVEFYIDGTLSGSSTSSPYTYSWNTASTPNGSHTLQTKAYDAAGNVGSSATVTVTVGNSSTSSGGSTSTSLPDVIVTGISWSPASPATGNQVVFSATVKNQGTAATPANTVIGVSFEVDGTQVTWSGNDSNSLAAGASITLTASGGPNNNVNYWTATGGTHTILAWVDDINRFPESNENNNQLTTTMTVGSLPDVIVTGISWSPASPATGNHVVFSATVKNQGNAATPSGVVLGVSFWIDGTKVSWSGNYKSSLAPGATVTLTANGTPTSNSINYWTATSGAHTVMAWVDDLNRFPESDENNNQFSTSLTVGQAGDTTPPSAPSSLTGSVLGDHHSTQLSWKASTDNVGVTGYYIWRNGVKIAATSSTSYTDAAVDPGGNYTYYITAYDAAYNVSGASNSITLNP